ncbi:MAG: type II toxin-antitoxin system Phd/YefM family antitoxin [Burkholderiales bacterium]|nr:type II toxin-antitoxin system Phd/YefM family antitoxin [Burkholderiales bacterium]
METFDTTSAKNRFGQLLEASSHAPVAIERHDRVVAYLVAPKAFLATSKAPMEDRQVVMRVIRTDTRDLTAFGKAVLKMLENRSWLDPTRLGVRSRNNASKQPRWPESQ